MLPLSPARTFPLLMVYIAELIPLRADKLQFHSIGSLPKRIKTTACYRIVYQSDVQTHHAWKEQLSDAHSFIPAY